MNESGNRKNKKAPAATTFVSHTALLLAKWQWCRWRSTQERRHGVLRRTSRAEGYWRIPASSPGQDCPAAMSLKVVDTSTRQCRRARGGGVMANGNRYRASIQDGTERAWR